MRKLSIILIATASIGSSALASQCPMIFENDYLTALKCADGTTIDVWRVTTASLAQ